MTDQPPSPDRERTPEEVFEELLRDATQQERNRALAIRWFRQVWNERRVETVDELFAPGGIGHTEGGDQGPAEFKVARAGLLDAFPDIKVEVEDTAADAEHVVVRWRARATHKGDGLGIKATGRPADFRGMTWLTFKDGLIIEGWDSWNLGKLMDSLR